MRRYAQVTALRGLLLVLAAVVVIVIVGGAYVYLELTGVLTRKLEPEALRALLEPAMTVVAPEGEGPFPAVVLMHGCNGLWNGDERRRIMDIYADLAAAEGVVAVVVDSYRPRGIFEQEDIDAVCDGWRLRGGERAGDAAVALAFARSLPFVDPERLALAGWSHGGWTVMDLLAMPPERMTPYALTRWPQERLDGLVGVYLTYPYCGFPALARYTGFADPPTIWALHGTADVTADLADCQAAYATVTEGDVDSEVIAKAAHGFDEPLNANFDPAKAETAHERFRLFLQEVLIPGGT